MRNVIVQGVGQTRFARHPDRNLKSLANEALEATLRDAGMAAADVEMVFFANALAGLVTGQETIRGQATLRGTGLVGKPFVNVDNACASGSTAVHLAWLAVASGQVDCAIAIGAEKLSHPDKAVTFGAFASGVDIEETRSVDVKGAAASGRSPFMDIYAEKTRAYMARSGATVQDFARVTVKSRQGGALNPLAQFNDTTTLAEVLAARTVAAPLTLPMCSPVGDGAAAVVLCSEALAERIGERGRRVFVRASVLASNNRDGAAPVCARRAGDRAYELAGIGPADIEVVELHDATAPAELFLYEHLRFCEPDGAPELLRSGATSLGGRMPVNPGGGLLSRGHPVGATGCAQIVELTEQLRGRCGRRQRAGARVALAECSGGQIGDDSAVAAVTILSI